MNRLYALIVAVFGALLFSMTAFAAEKNQQEPPEMTVKEKKQKRDNVPSTFGSSRLRNWYVLDNRNLVIELHDGRSFKASLMSPCHGLPFTDTLGFSNRGPYELDAWTTLHLPDGERCHIKDLTPYAKKEKTEKPS